MKRFVSSLTLVLLVSAYPDYLLADDLSEAKRADIVKLIEMTGALELGRQMSDAFVTQMTQAIKNSRPDLDPKLFDILREEVNNATEESLPEFVAAIVPVYHKYFTHQDIKGMLRFYKTPLGQKTIRVMPLLLQESMDLGRQWGQAIGPEIQRRVIERFKAEGVDLQASISNQADEPNGKG
jgi:hypothetical protein